MSDFKLSAKEVNKVRKPNPLFKGMSDDLKDVKNFKKIERKLNKVLKSNHKHETIESYKNCKECQERFETRRKLIHEIGFKNIEQYRNWKKIMLIIYNKTNFILQ